MSGEWRALLGDIRDGVRAQPVRVGLSFFAIAVGVTALTVLLALLGGLQERARQIVQELGVNVFGIAQSAPSSAGAGERRRLNREHVSMLRANLPEAQVSGSRVYDAPSPGSGGSIKVVAADHLLLAVRQWRLHAGRFIDPVDMDTHARTAVVSAALSRAWNLSVGDILPLQNTPYRVVGIVDAGGDAVDAEVGASVVLGERVVFVPSTTPPYWLMFQGGDDLVDTIFVRVPDADRFSATLQQARHLLNQPDQAVNDLSWITPELLLQRVSQLQRAIRLTVGSIAMLCLILGGTTLMSLMVANVRDRVTEIGLRRALGATARDIAVLFVLEGCLVTAAAASVGVLLTHMLLLAGRSRLPMPVSLGLYTVLVPLGVSIGLGFAFSYWPARFAAAIAPSEALRND